ncbi:MAG: rhomboid family intramembrane serine protease, partial [Pirellulaceae bacterium]|nr:rhomboid family intramembrane serine protease [Pirellulaceae bacterium]
MIIPYSTDAPIYHYPIATIGAIAVNTVASFVGWSSGADWMSDWILRFGEFNPAQWITNTFLHADIVHLIGNMIFLWTFGLIVEGKIGWWKFSIFYLSIAAMEGSFVQAVMFLIPTDSVGALGASGVITGLAATSLLWAPKNGINCLYAFFIGHFRQYSSGTVAVPVALFVVLLLVKDLAYAIIADFEMSSAMLHIIGGVAGGAAGWAMLVTGRVDC